MSLRSYGTRIGKRFEMGERIGSGAFGEIFAATDIRTRERVAVKLESRDTRYPQVIREARLMKLLSLSAPLGFPRIRWYGAEPDFNIMVMDLLGLSLEDLFNRCGRRFSLKTTLMLADQCLKRLEYVHSKRFVHRDIKPDNFLIGTGKRTHVIYLIDFGLAKKYCDSHGVHNPWRERRSLVGTARYASINNHLGIEQSRRDDLESLGYILLYFLRGKLPWQGLHARTRREKYDRICEKKSVTSLVDLCHPQVQVQDQAQAQAQETKFPLLHDRIQDGFGSSVQRQTQLTQEDGLPQQHHLRIPREFQVYLKYVRALEYEDRPDYVYLRKMFKDLFVRRGFKLDYVFDWIVLERKNSRSSIQRSRIRQTTRRRRERTTMARRRKRPTRVGMEGM